MDMERVDKSEQQNFSMRSPLQRMQVAMVFGLRLDGNKRIRVDCRNERLQQFNPLSLDETFQLPSPTGLH